MTEKNRIAALQALDILGAPREPALDRIVHLVRMEFGAQHAGIMMIDRTSAIFAARDNIAQKSIPREEAFCNLAIQTDEPLILPDTAADPRTHDHPQVARGICSYAGIPLKTQSGYNIGSLCVFDTRPLSFPPEKIVKMQELARLAMDCIELRRLAIQDHLTGAMNRRGFMNELDREMRRHDRGEGNLALALMDLDHFKQINDRFGHPAGDQVLRSVVMLAIEDWHQAEAIGRLGGEEFGFLMPGHDETSAFPLIEGLRCAIQAIRLPDMPDLRVSASFGIAEAGPLAARSATLLTRADTALYSAKAGARNRTALARDLPQTAPGRGN